MGASSVKNSRSPNCSWRNCVVGQRRPQIDARQVLGADQSGHCGWHRSNAWRHDLTAFAHPRRRRTQDGDLIAIAMSRYKGRQRAKSVEQDFPHYVDVGVPNGSDASLPLGRARNVRLRTRCNQQLMMKIYKHHELTSESHCLRLPLNILLRTAPTYENIFRRSFSSPAGNASLCPCFFNRALAVHLGKSPNQTQMSLPGAHAK